MSGSGESPLVSLHLDPVLREEADAHPDRREPANCEIPERLSVSEGGRDSLYHYVPIVGQWRGGVIGLGREVDRNPLFGPSGHPAERWQLSVGGAITVDDCVAILAGIRTGSSVGVERHIGLERREDA